jgi:hypothetical protein
MPITYSVDNSGHFILAVASPPLTEDEFVEFEIAHALDERIRPPVAELFRIQSGACDNITLAAMQRVLDRRREVLRPPTPHRCAIVVPYSDAHAWDLAKFYEGMVTLHRPESVIVFGDDTLARSWLAVDRLTGK